MADGSLFGGAGRKAGCGRGVKGRRGRQQLSWEGLGAVLCTGTGWAVR